MKDQKRSMIKRMIWTKREVLKDLDQKDILTEIESIKIQEQNQKDSIKGRMTLTNKTSGVRLNRNQVTKRISKMNLIRFSVLIKKTELNVKMIKLEEKMSKFYMK